MSGARLAAGVLLLAAAASANATCWDQAAALYGLPKDLLGAIADVESSRRPEAMNYSHQERTNSYDIGLMQINSRWLTRLAKFGITEQSLRKDPCQNLLVGAWILANNVATHGANWEAVGAYNAGCPQGNNERCRQLRSTYNWKVFRALQRAARPGAGVPNTTARRSDPAAVAHAPRIANVRLELAQASQEGSADTRRLARAQRIDVNATHDAETQ